MLPSLLSLEYCLPEVTGKSRLKGTFDWPLTTIGNSTGISCPYGPGDAQAQRTCVGDFSSGASWSVPYDNSCHFKSKRTQAFDKLAKVLRETAFRSGDSLISAALITMLSSNF